MGSSAMLGVPAAPVLTVEEAAVVLRIGRSLAYQLAREYDATGGMSGLPVIRLGGCLRVPRWALLELACCGRVVRLCDAEPPTELPTELSIEFSTELAEAATDDV